MIAFLARYALPVVSIAMFAVAIWYVQTSDKEPPATITPLNAPPQSPFHSALAGAGLVESQTENVSVGSALAGVVTHVFVSVGQEVRKGDPLFGLDPREAQAQVKVRDAALHAAVAELQRQQSLPRPEQVPALQAQVKAAEAAADDMKQRFERLSLLSQTNSVSAGQLESALYAMREAQARLQSSQAELTLLKAGAWEHEIALAQAAVLRAQAELDMASTELDRLVVRALIDGQVLQVNVRPGEFVGGPQGGALIVLGDTQNLRVRVDIDEHDIPRFHTTAKAVGMLRGDSNIKFSLTFVRLEPFVIPKRSLTGENTERIDTRVLQVIFDLVPNQTRVFVGQQLDVFIADPEREGE